jgi:hypothetical protein
MHLGIVPLGNNRGQQATERGECVAEGIHRGPACTGSPGRAKEFPRLLFDEGDVSDHGFLEIGIRASDHAAGAGVFYSGSFSGSSPEVNNPG